MSFTEIKIDKSTLPENCEDVEFEVLGDEGKIRTGVYLEPHHMFWSNEREFFSEWHVLKWRPIEVKK